jgi:hypothetical protein
MVKTATKKTRGRPSIPKENRREVVICLPLTTEEHTRLKHEAERLDTFITAYIRERLFP